MDAGFANAVARHATARRRRARRPLLRWAVAASVLALGLVMAPTPAAADAAARPPRSRKCPRRPGPTSCQPGSADLVALRQPAATPAGPRWPRATDLGKRRAAGRRGRAFRSRQPAAAGSTGGRSPTDFPLVDTARSAVGRAPSWSALQRPAIEAYLVRHNQMMANDGLGGFVPYVDVVSQRASPRPPRRRRPTRTKRARRADGK
jgi:hypothetical protein